MASSEPVKRQNSAWTRDADLERGEGRMSKVRPCDSAPFAPTPPPQPGRRHTHNTLPALGPAFDHLSAVQSSSREPWHQPYVCASCQQPYKYSLFCLEDGRATALAAASPITPARAVIYGCLHCGLCPMQSVYRWTTMVLGFQCLGVIYGDVGAMRGSYLAMPACVPCPLSRPRLTTSSDLMRSSLY